MENLRYMLYPHHSEDPLYFGYRFKEYNNKMTQVGFYAFLIVIMKSTTNNLIPRATCLEGLVMCSAEKL